MRTAYKHSFYSSPCRLQHSRTLENVRIPRLCYTQSQRFRIGSNSSKIPLWLPIYREHYPAWGNSTPERRGAACCF